jgi:tetratricopeptide (TPR) repeat protein
MFLSDERRWAGALIAALGLSLLLGLAPRASAQQPPAPPQQPPAPAQQNKPGTIQSVSPADLHKIDPQEDAAYKAFTATKPEEADHIIQLGEAFLNKYPNSEYAVTIYSRLTQAYFDKQELTKMYAAGEKALQLNPNDLTVLTLIGWVMPHAYNPNDLDAPQKLTKSETYLKHAIEVVGTLVKPATVTDEEFNREKNEALSRSHSGLGLVYFRQGRFAESVPELEQATQLVPNPDPTDFYVLGVDLQQLQRFNDAVTTFEKCAKIPGGVQDRCKQALEQSKRLAAAKPAPAKP